jgi:hypothetical protein
MSVTVRGDLPPFPRREGNLDILLRLKAEDSSYSHLVKEASR